MSLNGWLISFVATLNYSNQGRSAMKTFGPHVKPFILALMLAVTALSGTILAHSAVAAGQAQLSQRAKVFSACTSASFFPCLLTITAMSATGKALSPPPVWLMYQAGRYYLSEYRAVRGIVQTRTEQLPQASSTAAIAGTEPLLAKSVVSTARTRTNPAKTRHSLVWRGAYAF